MDQRIHCTIRGILALPGHPPSVQYFYTTLVEGAFGVTLGSLPTSYRNIPLRSLVDSIVKNANTVPGQAIDRQYGNVLM